MLLYLDILPNQIIFFIYVDLDIAAYMPYSMEIKQHN